MTHSCRSRLHEIHFTGSPEPFDDPFDAETINIGAKFADVQDEIAAAFEECILSKETVTFRPRTHHFLEVDWL
ncbi:hypothetical protein M378DRAFT_168330 [Amanita muscaria Koide BX008]|uniref:Uncharacterized protein n=1 Tax=Amanita muscaria (strain Koide BX008) TaxID=946122 RepID=A0A0C2WVD5_AMAMK|nr:hypothetical protein M378DRAFT_168330 [Amanita muscaria Koide BX008]